MAESKAEIHFHRIVFEAIAAVAALTTIFIYRERKEHRRIEEDVLALDKQIKLLTIAKLQNQAIQQTQD